MMLQIFGYGQNQILLFVHKTTTAVVVLWFQHVVVVGMSDVQSGHRT